MGAGPHFGVRALIKNQKYFQLLIEKALDLIALLDQQGNVIYNSPSIKRVLGYEESEMIGKSAFDLLHPDDLPTVLEAFHRGVSVPGATEYVEFRARHKDDSWRSFEAVGNNLLHDDLMQGIVVNFRDVTDRKKIEEKLERSEEYFRALIENTLDVITIIKTDGEVIYMSPAIERLLGYTPAELIGNNCLDFISPEDLEHALSTLSKAGRDTNFFPRIEFQALHKNGSYKCLEGIGSNYSEHPVIRGIVINLRDITERKAMEREMYDRNEELEAFAYTISHDLVTPAAVMEGYAKAALEADVKGRPEAERECLESIIKGARRMSRLIDSLLQYARAGRIESEIEMVDSNEALQEALASLQEPIEEKRVRVIIASDMPPLAVDSIKLYQVFFNLIENAIKHAGRTAKPEITIGVIEERNRILFFVKDNGPGIRPELHKKIFEPFKHFSITGSAGLGIGLSTVQRAVTAGGGRVWVESGEGRGSVFFFSGPAAAAP